MTGFLHRLVARAGAGDAGAETAGAVRPRLPARFEPARAEAEPVGEPMGDEPVPVARHVPRPAPVRQAPGPVHRGLLATPPPTTPATPAEAVVPPTADGRRMTATPPAVATSPALPKLGQPVDAGGQAVVTPAAPPADRVAAPPSPRPTPDRPDRPATTSTPPAAAPTPPAPLRSITRLVPVPSPQPPARQRPPAAASHATTPAEPVVHVTIGRVEIRTAPAPRRTETAPAAGTTPAGALEEYLASRAGASR